MSDFSITKDQLRRLQACRGMRDPSSAEPSVFVKFVGRLHMDDGLYHGTCEWEDADPDSGYVAFSLHETLGGEVHDEVEVEIEIGSDSDTDVEEA